MENANSYRLPIKKIILKSLGIFCFVLCLFLISFYTYFKGGESFEFCHYAEIATNILSGHGFSSKVHYPYSLAYVSSLGLKNKSGLVIDRFMLFSYWSAVWLLIGGGDFGMALGNGVAHALWVVLIYWWGRKMFSRQVAWFSAFLWAIHPVVLAGHDLFGYPDVLFGFLFTFFNIIFYSVLRDSLSHRPRIFLLLGLLAGGLYLTRGSFLFWVPFYILSPLLIIKKERWSCVAAFFLGLFVVWISWAIQTRSSIGALSPPYLMVLLAKDTLSKMPWTNYHVYTYSDFMVPGIINIFF
ncbi:MAG: glycosyltransferase family 39 protein [bacterium]